jgi:cobalt-precorrin-5B (C1)-methyltransferase
VPGSRIGIAAGEGVGTVTRAGLPLAVGEPAVNPAPRAMMSAALIEVAEGNGAPPPAVTVRILIPGGERLAEKP